MNDAPQVFVGIDPSITNTGLCILDGMGSLVFCADCGQGRKNKGEADIGRYISQANYIVNCLEPYHIGAIAWENYSFASIHRGYSLAECNGIMKASVYQKTGLHPVYVAPTTLKKFATGNGHAGKEIIREMARAECADLPDKASADICDAFFLAKFALYLARKSTCAQLDKGNPYLRIRLETTGDVRNGNHFE